MAASRLSTQLEPSLKAKSTITSRLRENEAKFIRQLEKKDQEILWLKKELEILARQRKKKPAPKKSQKSADIETLLKTVTQEKLQLERKLQLSRENSSKIDEKMLQTIRFKSSMCQKLEQELRQKEEEIIQSKSENFQLLKKLEFVQSTQSLCSGETEDLEARIKNLELMVNDLSAVNKTESGYWSTNSSSKKIGDDLSNITEEEEEIPPTICVAIADHFSEDLTFQSGQLLKVFGDKTDKNGQILAQIGDKKGFCPPEILTEIKEQPLQKQLPKTNLKVALYDYDPSRDSPNVDRHLELSFLAGDILHICESRKVCLRFQFEIF